MKQLGRIKAITMYLFLIYFSIISKSRKTDELLYIYEPI